MHNALFPQVLLIFLDNFKTGKECVRIMFLHLLIFVNFICLTFSVLSVFFVDTSYKENYTFSEGAVTHVRAYHPPAHHRPPTMDDLPVPQGSWKAQNDATQMRYNMQFIGGITFLAVTVGFVSIYRFYFHVGNE